MNLNSKLLRTKRKDLKLCQRHIAALTGLTLQTISNLESGKDTNPRLSTLVALSKALNTPIQDLLV